jgi:outer membrane protein, heavy metal efflux system
VTPGSNVCVALVIVLIACLTGEAQAVKERRNEKYPPPTGIELRTGHGRSPAMTGTNFALPPGVETLNGLTSDEAVAIALWNNGALHTDLAALGLARADLIEAGLLRNPIAQLVLPIGPFTQFEGLLNLPFELFWQRKRRIAFAETEISRIARSLEQTVLNLTRDVRTSYSDLQFAIDRSRLANEALAISSEIERLTSIRLKAGDVGEIEAMPIRQDLGLTRQQAERARQDIIVAHEKLRGLIGMGLGDQDFKLEPVKDGTEQGDLRALAMGIDGMLRLSTESRPELRAAELAIESATRRAKWEQSRIFTLSGLLNIKQGEGLGFSPRPGTLIELPIFNRNQGGRARADAEVERATWQYLAVRQTIELEVRESFTRLLQARDALGTWRREVLAPASENLRLSETSYQNGDQSRLLPLDASRRLLDLRMREAEMESEIRRFAIQLDRSLGRKPGKETGKEPR